MTLFETAAIGAGMAAIPCCKCGIIFHVPEAWDADRRAKHDSFHCPNGHSLKYHAKSEADILRDQLTRERARLDQVRAWAQDEERQRESAERSLRAHKGVVTKLRKRVAAGQCPCCQRTFRDLRDHMRAQHPDWNPEQGAEAVAAKSPRT